ncbi:MAG: methyltransferase domain-containing protein, partial [Ignavibacteria bacterium]|nr:methyltransferase domain-containing protein [Ignavibacteria bacterium]
EISSSYYSVPYFNNSNPKNVLVVGSGTGNDVAAALRNGADHVDAVEIDPAILETGKELHPESPYSSPKVNAIINDARSFIRYTGNKYDLIVYGLLDSHTLLSGKGGIRLDSYVYTVEAFKEARSKLKPNGTISLTFALLSKELGDKLYGMLNTAFDGHGPVVFYSTYDGGYTFIAGDSIDQNLKHPLFENVTNQFAQNKEKVDISTDDWPFFYMPYREYPLSSIALIILLLIISFYTVKLLIGKKES